MTTLKEWSTAHRRWVDEYVLSLRLAGASQAQIADLLTDAHEASDAAGETPESLFGAPEDYAASRGFRAPSRDATPLLRIALPVVVQVLLLLIGSYAIRDWITGADLVVNVATLVCWVVMAAIVFVVTATSAWGSTAIYRVGVFVVVFGVAIVAGVAGAVLSRRDAFPVVFTGTPAFLAIVAAVGVVGIAIFSTLGRLRAARRSGGVVDSAEGSGTRVQAAWGMLFWIVPLFMAIDAGYTAITS